MSGRNEIRVEAGNLPRYGARLLASDLATVNMRNRRNPTQRSRDERFGGAVDLGEGEVVLPHNTPMLLVEIDHLLSRDALEVEATTRRPEFVSPHNEEVG